MNWKRGQPCAHAMRKEMRAYEGLWQDQNRLHARNRGKDNERIRSLYAMKARSTQTICMPWDSLAHMHRKEPSAHSAELRHGAAQN